MVKLSEKAGAIGVLLIAMIAVQAGAALAKHLFPLVGARGATALRLTIAAIILCVIWRPWRQRLTWREYRPIMAYGAVLGVMNLSFYLALERIPLGVAVALEFTGPLAVAVLASHRLRDLAVVAMAAVGLLCVVPIWQASIANIDYIGVAFALLAGVCWALYIIFGQRAGGVAHGGTVTTLGMVTAACVAIPFCIVPSIPTFTPLTVVLPLAAAVAVLSSALPYSLEMIALQRLPTRTFGILMSVEPAIAALLGLVMLDERLLAVQWTGIGCVMLASAISAATASVHLQTDAVTGSATDA